MDFIAQFDIDVELGIRLFLAEIAPVKSEFCPFFMNCVDYWEIIGEIDNAKILTARISLRIIICFHSQHLPKPKIEICTTC